MATNLEDDDRDVRPTDSDRESVLPAAELPEAEDRSEFVARVILEEFGGPALCEYGRAATAVAARRIAQYRTGRDPTPVADAAAAANLEVPTVARAENALLAELDAPADPAEIRLLSGRVERCRQVLVATARERAGPPRLTTVLCGPGEPEPEEVTVPDVRESEDSRANQNSASSDDDVDPLPPDESAEELKKYYHRLRSDLRCARLGFRLYEAVVEAELGCPAP